MSSPNDPETPSSPTARDPSGMDEERASADSNAPAGPPVSADPASDPASAGPQEPSAPPRPARISAAFEAISAAVADVAGTDTESSGHVPLDAATIDAPLAAGTAGDSPLPADETAAPLPGPKIAAEERGLAMPGVDRFVWSDWQLRAAMLALACMVFLPMAGSFGLWDPWEVHYGEAGRQMIERGDWISPWWGSHWRPEGKTPEGEYFFSKPVLLLWMMGIGLQVFGFGEWGIRIGVAIVAIIGAISVYLAGSNIFSRRAGALMSIALITSPFYAMLGRQAQTDMPFVGLMTAGLAFFMLAVFGRDRNRRADRLSWTLFWVFTLAIVIPELETITVGQLNWRSDLTWIEALFCYGPTQLALYLAMLAVVATTFWRGPATTRGQVHLMTFYAFMGLATMGKGILGFALPGAVIFFYLVFTREWALLARVELVRGVLTAVLVGFPWYGAMFARHGGIGGAFWDRFIIHDHFKRLATGVHQIDTGSFEHFIKWLGYGLWPWGSFVPAILARAAGGHEVGVRSDRDRARLFLVIWFVFAFSLFTLSSTKFHHYIFPAVPAVAMLAALLMDDLIEGKLPFESWWPLWLAAAGLLVLVGFDLVSDPQHLKNMFTYKYDRDWSADLWNPSFQKALVALFAGGCLGLLLLAAPGSRRLVTAGVATLCLTGLSFSVWALDVYMPTIAHEWSQKYLWDRYYELCTHIDGPPGAHPMKRYCLESAISYKLNWRGETFYTQNEVLPVRDDDEWRYFIEQNGDRCFYAIMERSRVSALRNGLPAEQRDSVEEVFTENLKFILVRANCRAEEEAGSGEGAPEAEGSR